MGSDEIDSKLARRFVWGLRPELEEPQTPGEELERDAAPIASNALAETRPDADEGAAERNALHERTRRFTESLAWDIEAAWRRPDPAKQRDAVASLLARARGESFMLGAMDSVAAARLALMALRHRSSLPEEALDHLHAIALWLPIEGQEGAELLLEAARAGDDTFSVAMAIGHMEDVTPSADFGPRLAAIALDDGVPWEGRMMALRLIGVADRAARAPGFPLARAAVACTRVPHIALRWVALAEIARSLPGALTGADVEWMLEDAIEHPLPEWSDDEMIRRGVLYYPEELGRAVALLRPRAAEPLLKRLAEGDCAGGFRESGTLNAPWALQTLARSYPAAAEPIVARRVRDGYSSSRVAGVAGAAALGPALARPYLTLAATDGNPRVTELVRDAWRKLYDAPLPFDELAAIPPSLLPERPSDRLRAWLLALRGPNEARLAIAGVLVDAAPDAEALAALVVALGDDHLLGTKGSGRLESLAAWTSTLLERFGSRAVDALAWLATRYAESGHGWMGALADRVSEPEAPLDAAARARFADVAASYVGAGGGVGDYVSFRLLEHAQVQRPDVAAMLLSRALDFTAPANLSATAALVAAAPTHAYAVELAAALEGALARRDVRAVGRAIHIAAKAPSADLQQAARRAVLAVADWPWPPHALDLLDVAYAVQALRELGILREAWNLEQLSRPACAGFLLGLWSGSNWEPSREILGAMRAALVGGHARASAWAAEELVSTGQLSPRTAAFSRVLLGAPPVDQVHLLSIATGTRHGCMRAAWWSVVEALATSDDPEVAAELADHAPVFLPWKRERQRLLALHPRITVPAMRECFEVHLLLDRASLYWRHPADAVRRSR